MTGGNRRAAWVVAVAVALASATGEIRAACLEELAVFPLGPGTAAGMISPGVAVVGTGSLVQLVDTIDPAAPVVLGSIAVGAAVTAVAAHGDLVWVTTSRPRLLVLDVALPESPGILGSASLPSFPFWVTAGEGVGAVAVEDEVLLFTYSSGDGLQPSSRIAAAATGEPGGVAIADELLYFAANGRKALEVWSIADPAAPARVGAAPAPAWANMHEVRVEDRLVAVRDYGIDLFDVSDPAAPRLIGITAEWIENTPSCFDLDDGELVLTTWRTRELVVIDIGDPLSPRIVSRRDGVSDGRSITKSGSTAVLADGAAGVMVVDLRSGSAATLPGFGFTRSVALDDGFVAFGDDAGNVGILRAMPGSSRLELVSSFNLAGDDPQPSVERVAVGLDDGRLVAAHASSITVVDLTATGAPEIGAQLPGGGRWPTGVVVRDRVAYVVDSETLTVVDVDDPSAAGPVGIVPHGVPVPIGLAAGSTWLAVSGLNAPYSGASGRLALIDIASPSAPGVIASLSVAKAFGVAVTDDLILVAAGEEGLILLDASDPAAPQLEATVSVLETAPAEGVWVSGATVWVAGGFGAACPLRRFHLGKAASLVDLGCVDGLTVEDMAFDDGRAVLAMGDAGSAVAEPFCRPRRARERVEAASPPGS